MRGKLLIAAAAGAYAARQRLRGDGDDLAGQVALITGGSRGLGFLLARELATAGCRVAICARDAERLRQAREALAHEGLEVHDVPGDVSDADAVERVIRDVERHLGPVDILVNNAGVIQVGPLATMTARDFEVARGVMLDGILHTTLAVLPGMLERGAGRIVNVTSIGGRLAVPHLLPYTTAKFAATGFSEGLAAELAGTGVRVTTVLPGLMRTGSYLNAEFRGRTAEEARWFSLGSTLPLVTIDGRRAARQVVRALRRGDTFLVLSVPATLGALAHGAMTGTVVRALGVTSRWVLPQSATPIRADRGWTATANAGRVFRGLTALGRAAARTAQQYPLYPLERDETPLRTEPSPAERPLSEAAARR